MAEGDGTRRADWDIEVQVPLLSVLIWQTNAQENARKTSPGLWEAPSKEAPTPGEHRIVSPAVIETKCSCL